MVDIRVPQLNLSKGIQKAIVEVMDACLNEMKKTNKVEVYDLTVENGLFKSFDDVRLQYGSYLKYVGEEDEAARFGFED